MLCFPGRNPPTPRAIGRRDALRAGAAAVVAGACATGCTADRAAPPGPSARAAPAEQQAAPRPEPRPEPRHESRPAPAPRAFPGRPAQIEHGPRDRARVALTFHGGGDPATARSVLAVAERAGARVTVLAVGSWLDAHPQLARRILDGGHELGNHTQRHLTLSSMTEAQAYAEITDCAQRLRRLTGSIGTWFRPSRARYATPLVQRLARRAGYPHVLSYDVDSLDFTSPGAAAVIRNVTGTIRNGSVVSLHFGYADTVAAMPDLLEELARRELRAVTTTELLTP
ncbi:polysaccharide deacetylase family protein [Streptomyces sp. A3M-1-3]|uniref:polysaccharide deacetylase family protein n=1 Tax=Streptomyces sp. A3M-1-3 TaxID=2962044 RepID=UPI0020B89DC5|nr:polysaccharide deacetylase family protein [Streptomyces sp. A3M-1-3]MCP3816850.1 polysaccharide deacetylase family protein [Streptomyces sp. A3M-1-3]